MDAWAENRPIRTEHERSVFADQASAHLPRPEKTMQIAGEDLAAMKAAFAKRFNEDLPRTETLLAVAAIGYRMALRDLEQSARSLPQPSNG